MKLFNALASKLASLFSPASATGTDATNPAAPVAASSPAEQPASVRSSAGGGEFQGGFNYVIIGAGPAGVIAAEQLRKQDPNGRVTMISREGSHPYSRMAIPYVMVGDIEQSGTYLRKTEGYYDQAGISLMEGNITAVDAKRQTITLDSGPDGGQEGKQSVAYDRLLIASGATPVKPPIPGLDLPGVYHCWTLDDTANIIAHAKPGADVVLMGAGFIGCIILEALLIRGVNLTVVEAEDRMVARMMNKTGGDMITAWCRDKGVTVLTATRAQSVVKDHNKLRITTDNGQDLSADLVVVATGVKSNTDFLQDTEITMDGDGIVVDKHLRTNIPTIYAAGDCACGPEFDSNTWAVHAIQPTATEHGRIAAINMAGGDAHYQGSCSMNVLSTAGLISASFGQWQGGKGDHAETMDADNFRYIRLEFEKDHLIGALSLGRTDQIGCIRGLIQQRRQLGKWKDRLMADPSCIAEAYVACSQV